MSKHPKIILLLVFCFFGIGSGFAQPKSEKNIVNYKKLQNFRVEKGNLGKIIPDKADKPWQTQLTVTTKEQPDFIYNLAANIPLYPNKIKAGEILLLSFKAKTIFSNLETGEARTLWLLNVSDNPKDKIRKTISISSEWQQYFVPIPIEQFISPKNLRLALQFGFPPQEFLLKNLKLQVFNKNTKLEDLPKTQIKYAGMEADAEWRQAAFKRIEKHRMGVFELRFTRNGEVVKNLPVQITLKKHDFGWGAALSAKKIVEDPQKLLHFSKAFNLAVFENDLKIKRWDRRVPKETILQSMDMLKKAGITIKGHVLIWPGFRYLTPEFKKHKGNPEKINELIDNHLENILTGTKGKISHWDIVNEAYTNRVLQEITGSEEILYKGYYAAKASEPAVGRFTNEYGIISKGGLDKKKQKWYYDYIKRTDEKTGGLVDGIGIQCHIGSDLTPPEKVLDILDYYAKLNKKISISEFTMDIDDPEIRTQYTRDFLIAAFSHPSVSEFLFWGYQREKSDIFTEDWQIGTMGKSFFDLVHGDWKTDIKVNSQLTGVVEGSGFFGEYEYQYYAMGRVLKGRFYLKPGEKVVVNVELP